MTVRSTADVLDVTGSRVLHDSDGVLCAEKAGNQRLVDASDVMERFDNPKGVGWPHGELATA